MHMHPSFGAGSAPKPAPAAAAGSDPVDAAPEGVPAPAGPADATAARAACAAAKGDARGAAAKGDARVAAAGLCTCAGGLEACAGMRLGVGVATAGSEAAALCCAMPACMAGTKLGCTKNAGIPPDMGTGMKPAAVVGATSPAADTRPADVGRTY